MPITYHHNRIILVQGHFLGVFIVVYQVIVHKFLVILEVKILYLVILDPHNCVSTTSSNISNTSCCVFFTISRNRWHHQRYWHLKIGSNWAWRLNFDSFQATRMFTLTVTVLVCKWWISLKANLMSAMPCFRIFSKETIRGTVHGLSWLVYKIRLSIIAQGLGHCQR